MPRISAPLTAVRLKNIKPNTARVELADAAVPGLRYRRNPSGTTTWSLNIRDLRGKRQRITIGHDLGLAEARRAAEQIRTQIRNGIDPSKERKEARKRALQAKEGHGTLEAILALYFSGGPGSEKASKKEMLLRIRGVFRSHLARPAIEIASPDLQIAADNHPSAVSAGRAIAYLKPVAKWASRRGYMQPGFDQLEPPVTRSRAEEQVRTGQRYLSAAELRLILPLLSYEGHDAAARWMLLTGCRRDEAAEARANEINLQDRTWTLPADRRKDTRQSHRRKQVPTQDLVIPLSSQAIRLLQKLPSPPDLDQYLFTGNKGARLQNWDRWNKRIIQQSGVTGWDRHSLRRTTATVAGTLGAPPHVVQALLGHKNIGGQLHAGYSKATYVKEVAEILQAVADYYEQLEQDGLGSQNGSSSEKATDDNIAVKSPTLFDTAAGFK